MLSQILILQLTSISNISAHLFETDGVQCDPDNPIPQLIYPDDQPAHRIYHQNLWRSLHKQTKVCSFFHSNAVRMHLITRKRSEWLTFLWFMLRQLFFMVPTSGRLVLAIFLHSEFATKTFRIIWNRKMCKKLAVNGCYWGFHSITTYAQWGAQGNSFPLKAWLKAAYSCHLGTTILQALNINTDSIPDSSFLNAMRTIGADYRDFKMPILLDPPLPFQPPLNL